MSVKQGCALFLIALGVSAGVANGQSIDGELIVDAPALIPIPQVVAPAVPLVVQPAPVVVQRPVLVARPVPVAAPTVVSPTTPGVMQRVVVQRYPVGTPVVTQPAPVSQTVWYSAPAATIAPSLPAPTTVYYGSAVVAPAVVANYSTVATPGISGVAPTVVYRPVVSPVAVATPYIMGNGVLGQPKLYVQGQPLRNALRYISP